MDGWTNPAFRPSEATMTTINTRREAFTPPEEDSDLLTRTSWVDAKVAYREIKKGRAFGNTCALWLRWHLQSQLFNLGCFIQRHCGKVLFLGLLLLGLCCVGLKTATIETNVEKLWVEDGGRLQEELSYTRSKLGEGSGTTSELLIQTPKKGVNLLSQDSMLLHLQAVLAATHITVDMYDITWKFSDICYKSSFPTFEDSFIDSILETIIPCVIITPLDCFWEGAKLLGPDNPVRYPLLGSGIKWTNLNPVALLKTIKDLNINIPVDAVNEVLHRAGITTAYQEKPCLDPKDEECPLSSPNKLSLEVPNVGVELTGGCSGFAKKFMNWEEGLIVGGVQKNKSGYIVRAEALQSVIQLMGEKELYDYYNLNFKVHAIDWTQEKAKKILEAWQRKFTKEIQKITNETQPDNVHVFSSTSLMDILTEFSQLSVVRVALGYVLMLVYACISLLRWTNAVQSQSGIGIAGVLLVALTVAAGLGICSVMGISFNAATTQIIPFLALGLGVDDMFLIAHTFAENANKPEIPYMEQTGEALKRTGVTVLLTSLSNICAFFMAAIIPIPALRAFSLQAAILVLFNLASILLIYPAIVSVDLFRREERRVDVLCCFEGASDDVIELQPPGSETPPPAYTERDESPPPDYTYHQTITHTNSEGAHAVTVLAPPTSDSPVSRQVSLSSVSPASLPASASSSRQCLTPEDEPSCRERCAQTQRECCSWSLTWFAKNYYGPCLEKTPVKVLVVVMFLSLIGFGVWGTLQVEDGLDLTDIVPRETNEYQFLDAQQKYFGFFNMYIVTKEDFDYAKPSNQQLLHSFHQEFKKVKKIIKKEDGSLPDFWLELFRQWLLDLQMTFDKAWHAGNITMETWHENATDEAVLAYKLMVQTGDISNPINKQQINTKRLVDSNGIIESSGFYNYLTVWYSNDVLAYLSSQANFVPLPKEWTHLGAYDAELNVPRSQPISYAQIPFFLTDMTDTSEITATIEQIRAICDSYAAQGLPTYPSGIPFTFWEQYIHLRFYLMLALICVLGVAFLVITIILMNPWAAMVVVAVLAMLVVELFGFIGLVGIKLSAVPAVILIVSVGIGVEFTVHISVGFLTAIGSRNRRMRVAVEHMFSPVIHGAISTLLGVIMLVGSEFDFIVRYFFNVLTALVVLGILNGLLLLPVLLSILGPNSEVIPRDNPNRINTPTPEPTPVPQRQPRTLGRRIYPRTHSDLSLSTITEEPSQYSSHEIVVQPEVVVETTFSGGNHNSTVTTTKNTTPPASSSSSSSSSRHVTTVRAKATVTVEVHTPLPGSVEQDKGYKSKRRKLKELEMKDSSTDSDGSNK